MRTVIEAAAPASAYMLRAVEVGRTGMLAHRGGPFGAVVVGPGGNEVGVGCNQVTSANDPTAHAEVTAIRVACASLGTFLLEGCTLYTSCEPCPMCLAAAYWAHVREIVYAASRADAAAAGFDDSLIYDEIGRPPDDRRIPMRRLDTETGAALFTEWLALESRTPY